jgi:hypothetical protein
MASDVTGLAQSFVNTMTSRMRSENDYAVPKSYLGRVVSVRGSDAPVVLIGKQRLKRTSYRVAKSVSVANLKPGDEVLMMETYTGSIVMMALMRTDKDRGDRMGKPVHDNATTNVHGISNTANLVYTSDSRLSDSRTPTDGSVTKAKLASATALQAFNAQIGTSYTLGLSDADFGLMLTLSNALSITLTVPNESSVNFPVGSLVNFTQLGAGQVTVAAAGGVTINSQGAKTKTTGTYAVGSLIKMSSNNWLLFGNLAA